MWPGTRDGIRRASHIDLYQMYGFLVHGTGQGLLALAGFCNFNVKTFLKGEFNYEKGAVFVLAGRWCFP